MRLNSQSSAQPLLDESLQEFEILRTNEFDSDRKAMSIVVRHTSSQRMFVFLKGADSSVVKMLNSESEAGRKELEAEILKF